MHARALTPLVGRARKAPGTTAAAAAAAAVVVVVVVFAAAVAAAAAGSPAVAVVVVAVVEEPVRLGAGDRYATDRHLAAICTHPNPIQPNPPTNERTNERRRRSDD